MGVLLLSCFSHVWLFSTLSTVAHQAPPSIGFSRQEYWGGLPCPPPGDLPDPGIEPTSLHLVYWQVGSLPGKPHKTLLGAQTTEVCLLWVLEAGGPQSRYWQGWFPLGADEGGICSRLLSLLDSQVSVSYLCLHLIFLCLWLSKLPLLIRTSIRSDSVQFSSVAQSCLTLCDPINRSTPGLPVHHQLQEFTQTHVHWVGDAIQPSHPLSYSSPPASGSFPMSQLFAWGGQSIGVQLQLVPSKEHPGLISFRMDWLDLLAVQGTLKSLLQHHSSKASILQRSAFFTVQLSHPYMTTGKTIALTRRTFVGKVMSLLLNMLSRLVITFLPRSECLLISWLQSPSAVILEPKKLILNHSKFKKNFFWKLLEREKQKNKTLFWSTICSCLLAIKNG